MPPKATDPREEVIEGDERPLIACFALATDGSSLAFGR